MNIKRFLLVIFFACIIEIGVINFTNILNLLGNNSKNVVYDSNSMEKINWENNDGKLISNLDPNLIIKDVNTNVKKISIQVTSDKEIPYIDVFYTSNGEQVFNGDMLIRDSTPTKSIANINIDKLVKDLRIDLGDEPGLAISDVKVIINPAKIDFSISRVIAMIIIYYSTMGLLSLQKNPYYKKEKGEK